MAQTITSCSTVTGEKMTSPSINLHPDKRSPTDGHSSPARNGKTTPSNTERKPHINGHASPSHLAPNTSHNHAVAEAYMKTDDRMRLAKERREERERSLVAREQLIREKERRARLQYERTVEERWRRLEEQRQKEDLRRAAVEEKRRQQLEEERERLEALMKRSLERSLQLEQRNKRWGRGYTSGAGESEITPLPFSAASVFSHGIASPFPAVSESAPCSPHRSPFRSSLNPADHSRAGLQGGSQSTPNTPKKERLRRERRTASPGYGSPIRRSESPASVTKHLASPTKSKLASKIRVQSPSNAHQYPYSPTTHGPNPSSEDRKAEEKNVEQSKVETTVRKNTNFNSTNLTSQAEKILANAEIHITGPQKTFDKRPNGNTSEKNQSPDRKAEMVSKVDTSEKKSNIQDGDKKKESAQNTSTGKVAAGTTNAEEATRMLAERRRQARAQKELEEKKREQEEEKRQKEEQLKKQQEQQHQKVEVQQVKEKGKNEEHPNRVKQEEDKPKKEEQQTELQTQTDKEKDKVQAEETPDRHRQGRELQTQQEEEERQLRKKRIEEIMKRTRKGEADLKKEEQVETKSVSPPEEIKTLPTNAQVNEPASKRGECHGKVLVTDHSTKECDLLKKKAAAAHVDNQKSVQFKNNTHQVTPTHSVPIKKADKKQTSNEHGSQVNKEAKVCALKQQEREVEVNVSKQHIPNVKATDQIEKEPTKLAAEKTAANTNQREGGMINGAVKGEESALMRSHLTAEVSKQQSPHVSTAGGNTKGGSQGEVIRPSVTPLPVEHLLPPVIKLEPLDVKGTESCDGVQSMEVSPASKEELISIPEFSPINEIQLSSMSNTRALEDLMDLTGSVTYPKLSSEGTIGDCNKNLIEGVVSPMSDSKLIGMSPPSSNKLSIQ
ncbi:MAP7 domain-containing protein 2a isoform X2 [Channa argus]|uniref:MAP7 domain-containing protein 2a isoform X2 n=1 Tax=Channa argus TaxID=215402 RepID=UPI0035220395